MKKTSILLSLIVLLFAFSCKKEVSKSVIPPIIDQKRIDDSLIFISYQGVYLGYYEITGGCNLDTTISLDTAIVRAIGYDSLTLDIKNKLKLTWQFLDTPSQNVIRFSPQNSAKQIQILYKDSIALSSIYEHCSSGTSCNCGFYRNCHFFNGKKIADLPK